MHSWRSRYQAQSIEADLDDLGVSEQEIRWLQRWADGRPAGESVVEWQCQSRQGSQEPIVRQAGLVRRNTRLDTPDVLLEAI
jgi:hypothetical protein